MTSAAKALKVTVWHTGRAERYKAQHGHYPEWYLALTATRKGKRATSPAAAANAATKNASAAKAAASKDGTDYERQLLDALRFAGLPTPATQFKWHPSRQFRADFAYPDAMILIEVQGGIYKMGGGGHNRGKAYEDDREKYAEAQLLGWRVFEFGPNHITSGSAITTIERALKTFENKGAPVDE